MLSPVGSRIQFSGSVAGLVRLSSLRSSVDHKINLKVHSSYRRIYGHYVPLVSDISSAAQTDDQSMTSPNIDVKPAKKLFCSEMLKRDVCKHGNSIYTIIYFT